MFFNHFVATYRRFDGIILPEHIVKVPKSSRWFSSGNANTCNGVKLSSFDYQTKDLTQSNHKELRKNALIMHIQNIRDVLIGAESMDDPVNCVEVVCTAYTSLHKYYLCYESNYGYNLNCHEWEFTETTKV